MSLPRIAITVGEPAGIGPDIVLAIAQHHWPAELVAIADPTLLEERAAQLGIPVSIANYDASRPIKEHTPGTLPVAAVQLNAHAELGVLDPSNAAYVVDTLQRAVDGCQSGEFQGMVTAPVQKSVINDGGIPFSGHTEFLAQATNTEQVVMLLASGDLRVALATTHLPLQEVSRAITPALLESVIRILHGDLQGKFGIASPRISVLGLNPHAGEGGHLGREEIDVIIPVLDALRKEGMYLNGPLPADTAFNAEIRAETDAYLAMYHDQGLPVLKFAGFGDAVNVTLGLPIVRTSVDHGTALSLAGTGEAKSESLQAAITLAMHISRQGG